MLKYASETAPRPILIVTISQFYNQYRYIIIPVAILLCSGKATLISLMLGLYLNTLKIGHTFGRVISILNELTLQKGITKLSTNVFWTRETLHNTKPNGKHKIPARTGN